jgi:two-component system OmpR family sensor kinase
VRPRLGIRAKLLLTVVGALALALAIGLAGFDLLLGQRLTASATALAKGRAEAEASSLAVRGGRLLAPEAPDGGTAPTPVWVFAGSRVLEEPNVEPRLKAAAAALAAAGREQALDVGETRLYALPIVDRGTTYGTVVASVPLDPYEETAHAALVGLLILAALVLAAVALLSHWTLGRALRPVARMTADAATWSEHDLDRRFELGEPYDEVTRLAATLDSLLERIAASLRHEQRFTAEVSHELRTPLARISGEAELMLRRDRSRDEYRTALEAIRRSADQVARTVETLVAAAHHESRGARSASDARQGVEAAVASARESAPGVDLRLTLPERPVRVAADAELVERMLQPLLDNALRYGHEHVTVSVERRGSHAVVTVSDDGPGVTDAEAARIFEPGARGSAGEAHATGAGLGLSLAQRLARTAGGEIAVARNGVRGARFSLRVPLSGDAA